MYLVFVDLQIKTGCTQEFLQAVQQNAAASLRAEPGCLQFDICTVADDVQRVLLYERYADEDAFQAHLASSHFVQFDRTTTPLVQSKAVAAGHSVEAGV